jgi:hypothetical protein
VGERPHQDARPAPTPATARLPAARPPTAPAGGRMNRRGEIDKAISQARMGPSDAAFLRALLRRADNSTTEVTARYAVTLGRLAADAKLSERTMQRAQAHMIRHG